LSRQANQPVRMRQRALQISPDPGIDPQADADSDVGFRIANAMAELAGTLISFADLGRRKTF
jgi:hypothetical protein